MEPRVLAAISGDVAMARAGRATDMYQGMVDSGAVETRPQAKYGMLGAIYGGTTGESVRMRPRIEAIVKERLAGVRDGEMELVGRLAAPLPVIVIAELLGVPADDHERFRHWSDEIVLQLGETSPGDARRSLAARNALRAYFTEIVEARRREPRADLRDPAVAHEHVDRLGCRAVGPDDPCAREQQGAHARPSSTRRISCARPGWA